MRKILAAAALLAGLLPAAALAQPFPGTLPANTVVGRLGIGPGPAQAIPFATLQTRFQLSDYVSPERDCNAVGDGVTDDSVALRCAITKAETTGKRILLLNKYGFCPNGALGYGLLISSSVRIEGWGAVFSLPYGWLFPLASGCSTPWSGSIDLIKIKSAGPSELNFLQLKNFTLGNAISPQGRHGIFVDTAPVVGVSTQFGFALFENLNVLPTANGKAFVHTNDVAEGSGGMYAATWRKGLYWNGITLTLTGSQHTFDQVLGQGSNVGLDLDIIGGGEGTTINNSNFSNTGGALIIRAGKGINILGGGYELVNGGAGTSNSAVVDISADVGPVNGVNIIGATIIQNALDTVNKSINIGSAATNVNIGPGNVFTTGHGTAGNFIVNAGPSTEISRNNFFQPATIVPANWISNTGVVHTPVQTGYKSVSFNAGNYTGLVSDRVIAISAINAPRDVALPAAPTFPPGAEFVIRDISGSVNDTNFVTTTPAGSDNINGSNSAQIALSTPYAEVRLRSDGVSNWYFNNSLVPFTTQTLCYQIHAIVAAPCRPVTPSAMFDNYYGSTRGMLLSRGAATWGTVAAGTTGQVLTGVTSGDPLFASVRQIMPLSSAGAIAQGTTVFQVSAQSATEGPAQGVCPTTGTFRNLYIITGAIGGAAQTVTSTFRTNAGDSTLTCQIATGSTTCSDTTHTATCTAGQSYSLKVVTSATTGSVAHVSGGVTFDNP